ncbi:DUF2189 domain-containing protein [Pseudovibrio sp. Tun.PSC04-5.I4]|uniref:DUF2189 domain-containing protein n=1 Tax=Pseudovibrio sp. Tun.PSC04-5.I4 TaxID=1798213 RepID=UPI0008864932|nr:DUF2189 domain-containing protein [Pseudovibrio sp. Tun.PSC04-5.I4]SDR18029.1 Uncharacterized membrane protein [Pseudovibrio sp. Tun.PSC04-5.I4]
MSEDNLTVPVSAQSTGHKLVKPIVHQVTIGDITSSLKLGTLDFLNAPLIGLGFGAFFMIGGVLVTILSFWVDMSYISYPLACGFLLLGPFTALGLYEVSRRLQAGQTLYLRDLFGLMWELRRGEIAWMAFVVIFIQFLWMFKVHLLLALFLGMKGYGTFIQFAQTIFETSDGLLFLATGHLVGAIFAMLLFAVSVVSFPMLLDTELDFVTAMITSVKVVTGSPVIMIGWGLLITATLMVSMIPAFVGLLVTLPILGHTTWHLYKRVVTYQDA